MNKHSSQVTPLYLGVYMHAQTRDDASWLKVVLYTVAVPLTGGRSDSLYRGTTAAYYEAIVESVTGELWVVTSRRTPGPRTRFRIKKLSPKLGDRFGLLKLQITRQSSILCAHQSHPHLENSRECNPPLKETKTKSSKELTQTIRLQKRLISKPKIRLLILEMNLILK